MICVGGDAAADWRTGAAGAGGRKRRPRGARTGLALTALGVDAIEEVRDDVHGRGLPDDLAAELLLPVGADGRAQVIGGRDKVKILLAVEGHAPGRPAGVEVEILPHVVRHVVAAQVDDADAVVVHHVVQHVLLAQDLLLIDQDAQHGALPHNAGGRHLQQALIGRLQVLELHEVVLDEGGTEQTVRAHQQGAVFRHHGGR